MRLNLDEIYKDVAFKTGIPQNRVELVFRSMFELVAETMRTGRGENIKVPKMGKFVVPLRKLKYVNVDRYMEELSRYSRGLEQPGSEEA